MLVIIYQHKGNPIAGAAIAQKRRSKRELQPFAWPAMLPCAILGGYLYPTVKSYKDTHFRGKFFQNWIGNQYRKGKISLQYQTMIPKMKFPIKLQCQFLISICMYVITIMQKRLVGHGPSCIPFCSSHQNRKPGSIFKRFGFRPRICLEQPSLWRTSYQSPKMIMIMWLYLL